jgi:hypothetical protein
MKILFLHFYGGIKKLKRTFCQDGRRLIWESNLGYETNTILEHYRYIDPPGVRNKLRWRWPVNFSGDQLNACSRFPREKLIVPLLVWNLAVFYRTDDLLTCSNLVNALLFCLLRLILILSLYLHLQVESCLPVSRPKSCMSKTNKD